MFLFHPSTHDVHKDDRRKTVRPSTSGWLYLICLFYTDDATHKRSELLSSNINHASRETRLKIFWTIISTAALYRRLFTICTLWLQRIVIVCILKNVELLLSLEYNTQHFYQLHVQNFDCMKIRKTLRTICSIANRCCASDRRTLRP